MESGGIFEQLGINWKLLLSQAVNFFILLIILRLFVYKPLLTVIRKRNEKIKEGLEKAKEASIRLAEVDVIAKEHLKKADQDSITIIKNTEERAKKLEESLVKKAEDRQKELLAQMQISNERQREDARARILQGASELVKKILIKTVELNPKDIDEALIDKAVSKLSKE
ncbi:MAG: hypothetical protein EXS52_00800 [Candidatus Staskawiczbacteria bacterium]|nr:hypothetical protein [Candidatus Staskawiczbacteria bacterium]